MLSFPVSNFRQLLVSLLGLLVFGAWNGHAVSAMPTDPPVMQSQTFSVTVPNTSPENATQRFRVTLDFNTTVPTGTSSDFTVAAARGGSAIDLNSDTIIAPGTTSQGAIDFMSSGSQSVEIAVSALGTANGCNNVLDVDLDDPGDRTWNLTVTFPAGATIQGYHFTPYTALSDEACDIPSLRNTKVPGATISAGGLGQDRGPHPLDIVMVLDKSGSMNGSTGTETKIQAMADAARASIDQWALLNIDEGNDNDRVGVIFFNSSVDPVELGGSTFFVERSGTGAFTWSSFTDPGGPIETVTAGGSTAMGDGMREAFSRADVELVGGGCGSGATNDLALIVMTDGKQNAGNLVETCADSSDPASCGDAGLWALLPCDQTSGSDFRALTLRKSLIQTVYVGPNASVTATLMNGIAEQNGGASGLQFQGGMTGTFTDALVDILQGGTPGFILKEEGTLTARSNTDSYSFLVNETAEQLVATVDWQGPRENQAINLVLMGPDGNRVAPSSTRLRDGYSVLSYNLRETNRSGEWQAMLSGGNVDEAVPYEFVLLAEDTAFASQASFRQTTYGTGDDLILEVMLRAEKEPMLGVDGLRVETLGPEEGLGTLLHEQTQFPQADLPRDQATDAYSTKLYSLMQDEEIRSLIQPRRTNEALRLSDDGDEASGDRVAGDGIYTLRLPGIETPGEYIFNVLLDDPESDLGPLQRIETAKAIVQVRPNLAVSEVQAEASDNRIRMTFVPQDLFGNYVGPGYGQSLSVTTMEEGMPLQVRTTDKDTRGVYAVDIGDIPVNENPTLVFRLNGQPYHVVATSEVISGEIPEDPKLDKLDDGGTSDNGSICFDNSAEGAGIILFGMVVLGGVLGVRRRFRSGRA
mgnify:FL=1